MTRLIFWTGVGLIAYVYLLFPLVLALRAALRPSPIVREDRLRLVSVVIAARDEAAAIGRKLDSVLAADYPADRLEVIVASDGSVDATEAIVDGYRERGVVLLRLPRLGKADALRAGVEASRGEVLVFTDANGELAPGALRALVRPFADPHVGGVAGDQRYEADSASNAIGAGERRYFIFDSVLKRAESRAGDVISATGGLYAIRREFFEPVPAGVTDDAFLSMGVVAKGSRLVFAPDAVVTEPLTSSSGAEVARKARVITRGLRTVWLRRALLNPFRYGFYSIQLWTHKVLRRLLTVPLVAVALASILLRDDGPIYVAAAVGQLAFYGLGVLGLLFSRTAPARLLPLSLPAHFCSMNAAALVAVLNLVRGRTIETWQPHRPDEGVVSATDAMGRNVSRWLEWTLTLTVTGAVGALAAMLPLPAAAAAVGATVGAIFLLRPDLAVVASAALLYSNAAGLAVGRYGLPALVALVVPGLLFVPPLVTFLIARREHLVIAPAVPFMAAFGIVQVVSTIQATDIGRALASLAQFLAEGLALYLLVTNVIRTPDVLRRCLRVLLVLAALVSALMLFKAATGNYGLDFGGLAQTTVLDRFEAEARDIAGEEPYGGFERQSGPIGEPNRFAQYLLPLVPIAVLFARRARSSVLTASSVLAGIFVLAGIMLTFSRGAFLGLLVSAAVMMALRLVKVRHLVAGVAVLAVIVAAAPTYRERILSIEGVSATLSQEGGGADSSVEGRFTENAAALAVFIDHPFLGVGPGNFSLHYREYAEVAPANVRSGERAAHNLYLGVAAETGVLGLLAVLCVFAVTLRELFYAWRRSTTAEGSMLAATQLVVVVGLMVTSVFLHFGFIRYFWLFMALAAVTARLVPSQSAGPDRGFAEAPASIHVG